MLRYFFLYEYFYIWGVFNVVSVGLYLWTFQEPKEQWWIPFLQLNIEFLNYGLFLFSVFFFVFILFCKLFVVYLKIAVSAPPVPAISNRVTSIFVFFPESTTFARIYVNPASWESQICKQFFSTIFQILNRQLRRNDNMRKVDRHRFIDLSILIADFLLFLMFMNGYGGPGAGAFCWMLLNFRDKYADIFVVFQ